MITSTKMKIEIGTMTSEMHVYHYTDDTCLPLILAAGELRPSGYGQNWPIAGFLWATTRATPDPTSRPMRQSLSFYGGLRLVRFTLPSKGFMPFNEQVILQYWGPKYLDNLERNIGGNWWPRDKTWRVHVGALPLKRVIRIEIRHSVRWEPLTAGEKARMIEEGIGEILADAHYSKKDEEDDYEGYEGFE